MAGIYIHIPFCKQACNYCDFHFSTSLKHKNKLIEAIILEISSVKNMWQNENIETIYFGGGTPSIIPTSDIERIMQAIASSFNISSQPEITLEANPDDLSQKKLLAYQKMGINRLSIGIQSFNQNDLQKLNRSHTAQQAENCIKTAQDVGFKNITIDLIYGIPGLTDEGFVHNIDKVLAYSIPHVSAYALTVEPKTALAYQINKGNFPPVSDIQAAKQFDILQKKLTQNLFLHYEISNFGKPSYLSKHNSNYWRNKPYLGLGPAAHSYYNNTRSWNISNNISYIKKIQTKDYFEIENLSKKDLYNELIMTGLRTMWGVDLTTVYKIGEIFYQRLLQDSKKHIEQNKLFIKDNHLIANHHSWFLVEGIISDLFWV